MCKNKKKGKFPKKSQIEFLTKVFLHFETLSLQFIKLFFPFLNFQMRVSVSIHSFDLLFIRFYFSICFLALENIPIKFIFLFFKVFLHIFFPSFWCLCIFMYAFMQLYFFHRFLHNLAAIRNLVSSFLEW